MEEPNLLPEKWQKEVPEVTSPEPANPEFIIDIDPETEKAMKQTGVEIKGSNLYFKSHKKLTYKEAGSEDIGVKGIKLRVDQKDPKKIILTQYHNKTFGNTIVQIEIINGFLERSSEKWFKEKDGELVEVPIS